MVYVLEFIGVMFVVTQMIVPLFTPYKFFWLFRKSEPKSTPPPATDEEDSIKN